MNADVAAARGCGGAPLRRLAHLVAGRSQDASGYLLVAAGTAGFLVYEELILHPRLPFEVLLLGLVFGSLNALPALGLVLIYRANRIINFAQGELGGFAAVLAGELLFFKRVPFGAAFVIAVVAAALAGALIELTIVRAFFNAPRLILTVATIGVAQVLAALQLLTPGWFGDINGVGSTVPAPINLSFTVGVATFDGAAITALVLAPLLVLALVAALRFTMLGSAIRAAAEDSGRARSLGIPVKRLSTIVWVVSAVVSAIAALLTAHVQGFAFGQLPGPGLLLRVLAPATIGRFTNLGVTFVAALALGMIDQGIFYNTATDSTVELSLFVVILLALLLRTPLKGRRALAEGSAFSMLREVRPIPQLLRSRPEIRLLRLGPPLLITAFLVLLPQLLRGDQVSELVNILVYAMVAISLVPLSGYAGQISLGQWAIAGVGAFAAVRFYTALPQHFFIHDFFLFKDFFFALIAGALVGAVVSAIVGLPALRLGGYLLAVVTLGFAVAADASLFQLNLVHIPLHFDRPSLFGRFNTYDETTYYYLVLAIFLLCFAAVVNFRHGSRGRALVAVRDNELAGSTLGLSPLRVKLVTFALSGFIAALAGGLYAFENNLAFGASTAHSPFLPQTSLIIFAIVVFGGLGSPLGAALGAALIGTITSFAPPGWDLLASGAGILVLMLIAPGGIGQIIYDIRDAAVRVVQRRHEAGTGAAPPTPDIPAPLPSPAGAGGS